MNSGFNLRNYLNVVAFIGNVLASYLIGARGVGSAESNEYLSLKYQTLVTPSSFAFAIWGIIFLAQAAFTVAQLLPNKRGTPIVQEGINDFYIGTCICQIVWSYSFGHEFITLSFLAMVGILVMLIKLVKSSHQIEVQEESTLDYFLFRFPFVIHLGWIIVASVVNLNVLFVSWNAVGIVLTVLAVLSLVVILSVATYATWWIKADLTIPLVLAWAMIGISEELKDPKQSIVVQFRDSTVQGVRFFAGFITLVLFILIAARAIKTYVKMKSLSGICGSKSDVEVTVTEKDEEDPSSDYVKV